MTQDSNKPAITADANAVLSGAIMPLDLQPIVPTTGLVPANTNLSVAQGNGTLTYANANPEERELMDRVIAEMNLLDSETIIKRGNEQRNSMATLADKLLDSMQPEAKMAFAKALAELIKAIAANSVDAIKGRIGGGAVQKLADAFSGVFGGKDAATKKAERMMESFMTDISASRRTIQEVTDRLQVQQIELGKNFVRINELGAGFTVQGNGLRVERAAVAEFIRRIESGENPILRDLEEKAKQTGRPDDADNVRKAQANWNVVRVVDGNLLSSIAVYDKNIATLLFTRDANVQNRLQTQMALTDTVTEWKGQLAMFGTILIERAAQLLLQFVRDLTAKGVKAGDNLFDQLVDMTVAQSAQGTYNIRQLIESQGHMGQKLLGVQGQIDAKFEELATDKTALIASSAEFRRISAFVYSTPGGILRTTTPTSQLPGQNGPV